MKKYTEFLKQLHENKIEEASGKNFIDVFDEDKPFGEPLYRVHRDELIGEIKELLLGKENGYLERVTVFADLPVHGKNKPSYLADVLPAIKKRPEPEDEENPWADPKDDIIQPGAEDGDDAPEEMDQDSDPWIDVEFEVVDVDETNNLIVAMPYSLRRKKVTTPIKPKYIHEIYYKKVKRNAP